jgi:PKD repeat protein
VITNLNPGGAVQNTYSAPFPVIITGTGFDTVSDPNGVTVDGSGISYTVRSPTQIDAVFPETVDDVPGNHPVIVKGEAGSSAPYNFVVSGKGFNITTITDGIGWINPAGPIYDVPAGSSKTFNFKPTAGAMIKNVTVNEKEVTLTSEMTYTIENINGDYKVRLNCEPLPGVIIPSFTVTRLEGNTVRFTDASWGSPNTWKWDFGDRQYGEGSPVEHTYEKPGVYTVSMWARNDFSQSQVVGGNIEVP